MQKYHKLTLEALQASSRVKVKSFELYLDSCEINVWTVTHRFRVYLSDMKKSALKQKGVDPFLKWDAEAIYLLTEEECREIVEALHAYIFNNKK